MAAGKSATQLTRSHARHATSTSWHPAPQARSLRAAAQGAARNGRKRTDRRSGLFVFDDRFFFLGGLELFVFRFFGVRRRDDRLDRLDDARHRGEPPPALLGRLVGRTLALIAA